jgi:hypothetical protein
MVRCLFLLVALLLATTGSPVSHGVSDWTQVLEASLQQPPAKPGVSSFGALSAALFALVVTVGFTVQARRQRKKLRLNAHTANLLWTPRRK